MSVYRINLLKDSTIYSEYPDKNTGIDEILELKLYNNTLNNRETSRILLGFDNNEINNTTNNIISGSYEVSLNLEISEADNLPLNYSLYCHPLYVNWDQGIGKNNYSPYVKEGVSWKYSSLNNIFTSSNVESTSSYKNIVGGGDYYPINVSQSFNQYSNKNINFNITNLIILPYYYNGFIIKHHSDLEFNSSSYGFNLSYYSNDTHTIYSPYMEFKWDDSIYHTSSLLLISSSNINITNINNKGKYYNDEIFRFELKITDKYPTRKFVSGSLFTNKRLPSSSYYAVKDIKTNRNVIDFSEYTKISHNNGLTYFKIYMSNLYPERYYKFLYKIITTNEEFVIEDNNYFKVIN